MLKKLLLFWTVFYNNADFVKNVEIRRISGKFTFDFEWITGTDILTSTTTKEVQNPEGTDLDL